jgi:hypothetical protein
MIERREHASLVLEPTKSIGIVEDRSWQYLECHIPSELRIPGSIHFAHAADAERRPNLVMRNPGTSQEPHSLQGMFAAS